MPRKAVELAVGGTRLKSGQSQFSKRKTNKLTDETTISEAELQWLKDYAIVLKAVGWSYRYISDTLSVQTGLIKAWLEEPESKEKIAAVQADIVQAAADHLRRNSLDATEMLMELARRTTDDGVKLKAIVEVLDRTGLAKVNKSESIVTKNDRTEVTFASDLFERLEGLPIETQTKIAEMMSEVDKMVEEARHVG